MKAWQLHRLGGELRFNDVRTPEPRPGSALVRIEAASAGNLECIVMQP